MLNSNLIIVGWNERTSDLIDELLIQENQRPIVLIDSSLDELPRKLNNNDITFLRGHAYNDDVLNKADIQNAETILISSDASLSEKEADKLSILICVTAKGCNSNIKAITEIRNDYQIRNARSAGADTVIGTNKLTSQILYQQTKTSNFNQYFNVLCAHQFNKEEVSDNLIGKTILECTKHMLEERKLLIGLIKNNQMFMNPDHEMTIQQGNVLITITKELQQSAN